MYVGKVCCDNMSLGANNQLEISSSAFTFGVAVLEDARVLGFHSTDIKYNYKHSQVPSLRLTPGADFSIEGLEVNNSLLLVRFFLKGKRLAQ